MNRIASKSLQCEWAPAGRYSQDKITAILAPDGTETHNCMNRGNAAAPGCQSVVVCATGKYATTTICLNCPAGYYSSAGQTKCEACSPGLFTAINNPTIKSACSKCAKGLYQNEFGREDCVACLSGKSSPTEGAVECLACRRGMYSKGDAIAIECLSCPAGFYQSESEQGKCHACVFGTGAPESSSNCVANQPDLTWAPPILVSLRPDSKNNHLLKLEIDLSDFSSKFSSIIVESSTKNNFVKVHENILVSKLVRSNKNIFVSLKAAGIPVWSSTLYLRAAVADENGKRGRWTPVTRKFDTVAECSNAKYLRTHKNDFACDSGTVLDILNANSTYGCFKCPLGGVCLGPVFAKNIAPKKGYWQVPWSNPHSSRPVFARCPIEASCHGVRNDRPFCNENMPDKDRKSTASDPSACDVFDQNRGWWPAVDRVDTAYLLALTNATGCNGSRVISQCKDGYTGPLCAYCRNGYTRIRGQCTECFDTVTTGLLLAVATILMLVGMYYYFKAIKKSGIEARKTKKDINRIVIICFNLAQIQNSVTDVLPEIPWPPEMRDFFDIFDWVNFDLASMTAPCDSSVNFKVKLSMMSILPIIVLIWAFVLFKRGQKRITKRVLAHHLLSHEQRLADYKQCHVELFDMVDVDCSGSLNTGEIANLTKLVGMNTAEHPITKGIALALIQTIVKSKHATTMSRKVYMESVLSGTLALELEKLFEKQKKRQTRKSSRKQHMKKLFMKSMKREKSMANLVGQVEDTSTGTNKKQMKKKQENESKKMLTHNLLTQQITMKKMKPKKLSKEGKAGNLTRTKSTMLHNDDDAHDILVAWNDHRKLVASSWSWPAQFLMFLHTPISRRIFHYFNVDNVGIDPSDEECISTNKEECIFYNGYLRQDYRIQVSEQGVYTPEYQQFLVFVLIVLIFYTLLLPLSMAYLILIRYRSSLYDPKVSQKFGWLYSRLTRGAEFWEVHEMFRKMILTGIIVFAPPNPTVRGAMCLCICIIAQINLNYFKPYRSLIVFWVEQAAYTMALAVYLCAILFIDTTIVKYQQRYLSWFFIIVNVLFWSTAFGGVFLKLYLLKISKKVGVKVGPEKKTIEFGLPVTESEGINSNNTFTSSSRNRKSRGTNGQRRMNFRDTAHLAVHFDRGLNNIKAHEESTLERLKKLSKRELSANTRLEGRIQRRKSKRELSSSKTSVVPTKESGEKNDQDPMELKVKMKLEKPVPQFSPETVGPANNVVVVERKED